MSTHFLWSNSYKLFENKRGFTEFLIEQVKHNSKIFASVEQIICFFLKKLRSICMETLLQVFVVGG